MPSLAFPKTPKNSFSNFPHFIDQIYKLTGLELKCLICTEKGLKSSVENIVVYVIDIMNRLKKPVFTTIDDKLLLSCSSNQALQLVLLSNKFIALDEHLISSAEEYVKYYFDLLHVLQLSIDYSNENITLSLLKLLKSLVLKLKGTLLGIFLLTM